MRIDKQHSSEHARIAEAYMHMATEAHYRPQAPSDGMSNILPSPEQLTDATDATRLERGAIVYEALTYATRFIQEENTRHFSIGVSNYSTNRALVYTIEAARLLCSGTGDDFAVKLLQDGY
jgi:hypothetical protein